MRGSNRHHFVACRILRDTAERRFYERCTVFLGPSRGSRCHVENIRDIGGIQQASFE